MPDVRRRQPERPPDRVPTATIALDVNLTAVDLEAWCPSCENTTASSVVAIATPAGDPSTVLLRSAQWLCHVCGASGRG